MRRIIILLQAKKKKSDILKSMLNIICELGNVK